MKNQFLRRSYQDWQKSIDENSLFSISNQEILKDFKIKALYEKQEAQHLPHFRSQAWDIAFRIHDKTSPKELMNALSLGASALLVDTQKDLRQILKEVDCKILRFHFFQENPSFERVIEEQNISLQDLNSVFYGNLKLRYQKSPLHRPGIQSSDIYQMGANGLQELLYVLLATVEMIDREEKPEFLEDFSLALQCETQFFFEIAKLRALQLIWPEFTRAYGIETSKLRILSQSAKRMLSRRDPWVNLLRLTSSAFAASLGGAHAILSEDFDLRNPQEKCPSQRFQIQMQNILWMESHLDLVQDPAEGSDFIEALTQQIADRVLQDLKTWEAKGGLKKNQDSFFASLQENQKLTLKNIQTNRKRLTSVNEFSQDSAPLEPKAEDAFYLDQDFEAFWQKSDAICKETGKRPEIKMLYLGEPASYHQRKVFAENFWLTGGILAKEESRSKILCICGADSAYENIPQLLKEHPAYLHIFVGKLENQECIHVKSNRIQSFESFYRAWEATQ